MADRVPAYPMLPTFNPPILQHQQQSQQAQQQIQHPPQQLQDDQSRWQQQMQHIQQQYRAQAPQDINQQSPPQVQFAELMKRSQNLSQNPVARAQQQQQQPQQQQQQQQPFAIASGIPQINQSAGAIGQNAQSFQDSSSAQASHIPPNFSNMIPNGSVGSAQPRNPQNLMQGFQSQGVSRQLELIGMAQNQQPQNGPVNIKFNPQQLQPQQLNQLREQQERQHQQQQQQFQAAAMNHSSPNDLFASPGMSVDSLRRPSPHPANIQQAPTTAQPQPAGMMNQQSGSARGPTIMADINQRIATLKTMLPQLETAITTMTAQLNHARGTPQEGAIYTKLQATNEEYKKRQEYFNKLVMQKQIQQHQQSNGCPAGPSNSQQSWIAPPMGQPSQQQQLQANAMQSSPSLPQAQSQSNHLINQGLVPPRLGPTPQQHSSQPLPHNTSPFNNLQPPIGAPFSFHGNNSQTSQSGPSQQTQATSGVNNTLPNFGNGQPLAPLEKNRFDLAFRSYCLKRNLKLDSRLLTIENREVEPYRLHVEVIKEGGSSKIDSMDMWNIIGGRLGFVQFPGNDTEPAKSGPGVAQQLAHLYKEYLALFDQWYMNQAMDNKRLQMSSLQAQMLNFRWSPQQIQHVMTLAQLSVADLHAKGIDENTINFIETNRSTLQRTFQDQKAFRDRMRFNTNQPQTHPQGAENIQPMRATSMGSAPSFGGGAMNSNNSSIVAAAAANRQQQFLQQHYLQQQQSQLQSVMHGTRIAGQQGPQAVQQQAVPSAITKGNGQALVNAEMTIRRLRQDFIDTKLPNMLSVDVPTEHRVEFNQVLEQLFRQCADMDQKLSMVIAVLKQDEVAKKLIAIICTVQHQRHLLSTASNPRFLVNLDSLRTMSGELQRIIEFFTVTFHAMRLQQQRNSMNQLQGLQAQHQQQPQQNMVNNLMVPQNPMLGANEMQQNRASIPQQHPTIPGPSPQQLHPQITAVRPPGPPITLQAPPPVKRGAKAQQPVGQGAVSTPSPVPMQSATTPVASAPTPTAIASSPPATKSPKTTKAPPKPKAPVKTRRVSKVVPPVSAAPPPASLSENIQASGSSSNLSVKRGRDEDSGASNSSNGPSTGVASEPSPPKRAKTEWDSPPSEVLKKKKETVENIKTEEEAGVFFQQMTELIKKAAEGETGEPNITNNISTTLEMILKGYGSVPDASDSIASMSMLDSSSMREQTPPPTSSMNDAFDEYFDFSFGAVDDEDNISKAPTPDLISSSSTNPSPESNHEEASHHIVSSATSSNTEVKLEDSSDPLRLGPWKDIDGGEATYYQSNEWKWDSPMTSLEHPWAIFNP